MMPLLKAAFAVLCVLIGLIAVFVGGIVTVSSLKTGTMLLSWGKGITATSEVVAMADSPSRYWMLVTGFGIAPVVIGAFSMLWGWRQIR